MIIFYNKSAEIKTKSADVLLKMIIILNTCVLKMNGLYLGQPIYVIIIFSISTVLSANKTIVKKGNKKISNKSNLGSWLTLYLAGHKRHGIFSH